MGIEHSKHIFRVFLLLAVVLVSAIVGRIVLVKVTLPGFGLYGHYRAESVAENADREIRHGGDDSCTGCHGAAGEGGEGLHDEIKETHDGGPHKSVPCEDCHDALAAHVRDGEKIADMPRVKSVTKLCERCHLDLDARPADFPRVNTKTHPVEMGAAEATDDVCFECHSPHDPTP